MLTYVSPASSAIGTSIASLLRKRRRMKRHVLAFFVTSTNESFRAACDQAGRLMGAYDRRSAIARRSIFVRASLGATGISTVSILRGRRTARSRAITPGRVGTVNGPAPRPLRRCVSAERCDLGRRVADVLLLEREVRAHYGAPS